MFTTPSWTDLEPRVEALLDRPLVADEVPAFLADVDAINREVREAYSALSRAKDEDTSDEAAKEAFLRFVQDVMPHLVSVQDRIDRKLLAVEGYEPPSDIRPSWDDMLESVAIFREENVPLSTEEQALTQRYGEITGRTRAVLDGTKVTLPKAHQRLEKPDRRLREEAWRAIEAGKAEQQPDLDALFLELVALRERVARNADEPDFRAYAWKSHHRREYSVDDALAMHAAVEAEVVPRLRAHNERRRERLGVERLRPWDMEVDPSGLPPLAPFETVDELEDGLSRMFHELDSDLGDAFDLLRDGWMDLEPRDAKVPGMGYQSYFAQARRPYIYWSAVGTDRDLVVMRHEAGHAFHSILTDANWSLLRQASNRPEMNEFASEAMELLTLPLLERERGGFYDAADADRSRTALLERIARLLVVSCQVDAIQHWIYQQPAERLTVDALDAAWLDVSARFDVGIDWTGLERERAKGWQILHLYLVPFYYLEYGIAYLGALQLWERMDDDPVEALQAYKRALALGGTRPLDELYAAAGVAFRFDRALIGRLAQRWEAKLIEAWR